MSTRRAFLLILLVATGLNMIAAIWFRDLHLATAFFTFTAASFGLGAVIEHDYGENAKVVDYLQRSAEPGQDVRAVILAEIEKER